MFSCTSSRTGRVCGAAAFGFALLFAAPSLAIDRAETAPNYPIEAYESNRLGYTWQDDDVGFVDFTVSLKYQLLRGLTRYLTCGEAARSSPDSCDSRVHWKGYLAFTGRYGFYVHTRPSEPVIARNYTPKLMLRYSPEPGTSKVLASYIDLAYAHESNGQTTNDPAKYFFDRRNSERPEYALDEVSRGWDYVQIAAKRSIEQPGGRLSLYCDLRFFLKDGLIQGPAEEYNLWENDPDGRPRRAFDGVLLAAEKSWNGVSWERSWYRITAPRVSVQYETGYDPAFRFHTFQVGVGARVFDLPITIWYRDGYGHSLARYYKQAQAVGIELRFAE